MRGNGVGMRTPPRTSSWPSCTSGSVRRGGCLHKGIVGRVSKAVPRDYLRACFRRRDGGGSAASMSTTGLAGRPGTDVDPMCSTGPASHGSSTAATRSRSPSNPASHARSYCAMRTGASATLANLPGSRDSPAQDWIHRVAGPVEVVGLVDEQDTAERLPDGVTAFTDRLRAYGKLVPTSASPHEARRARGR
jgi:hypothetical protein